MPPAKKKLGRTYPAWLKAWRKAGAPVWPAYAKLVIIHWQDAAYSEESHGTLDALLVGIVKEATDDHIALAMEGFEDKDTRTHITVPAGMVRRVIDVAIVRAFDE